MAFKNGLSTRIVDQFKDRKVFVAKNKAALLSRMNSKRNTDETFYICTSETKWDALRSMALTQGVD
jgi:hypothetical protein